MFQEVINEVGKLDIKSRSARIVGGRSDELDRFKKKKGCCGNRAGRTSEILQFLMENGTTCLIYRKGSLLRMD